MERSDREKRDKKNAEYLAEIDRRIADLKQGKGHVHELIETEENNFDDSKVKGRKNMGQTDSQFKAFLRFLFCALKEVEEEEDREKRDEKLKKILDNIQKTMED